VRVAVRKLSGVESVNVSLERASAEIQLRPGNTITLDQLRTIIRNNGFTPKEATVSVVGKLIERGGQPALEVIGTNTVLLIVADPKQPAVFTQAVERLRTRPAGVTQLTGVVESWANSLDRLTVHTVSEP
jgi:hypothetical protein